MIGILVSWIVSVYESFYGASDVVYYFDKFNAILNDMLKAEQFKILIAVVSAMGIAMMIIYLLIYYVDAVTGKTFTIEVLFSGLLRLALGAAFSIFLMSIISGLLDVGAFVAVNVYSVQESKADFFRTGMDDLNKDIDKENQKAMEKFEEENKDVVDELKTKSTYTDKGYVYYIRDGKYFRDTVDEDGNVILTDMISPAEKPHSEYGYNYEYLKETIQKYDLVDGFGTAVKLILPYILVTLGNLAIMFICISRLLELVVRVIFAPIAVSDIFTNGENSSGFRYLKKIFAYGLQFVMVVVISMAFSTILKMGIFSNGASASSLAAILTRTSFSEEGCKQFVNTMVGSGHYIARTALQAAKFIIIMKSLSICNEIVGV